MVPSKENNAVFWLIGRSCPPACAEPPGAKLPAKVRIEPSGMPPGSTFGSGVGLCDGKIPESGMNCVSASDACMLSNGSGMFCAPWVATIQSAHERSTRALLQFVVHLCYGPRYIFVTVLGTSLLYPLLPNSAAPSQIAARLEGASVARMSEAISGSAASIITTRREAPGGMDNNP